VGTTDENSSGGFGLGNPDSILSRCSIKISYKPSRPMHNKAPQHTVDDRRILLSEINPERSFVTERKAKGREGPARSKYP
jgi:hypothetical protein